MTRRLAHAVFWVAQPAGAVAIGLGLLGVAIGRWVLKREAALRAGLLLAMALAGCSMNKSAERQDSFGQQAASRVEEGPVKVTVLEFGAAPDVTPDPTHPEAERRTKGIGSGALRPRPFDSLPAHGPLLKATVTERAPVVSTTQSQTVASGEAHSASAARFGFSPWQWAIGGLALLVGLYGLWRLKAKLGV